MLYALLAIVYAGLCVATGVIGRNTRIGFWGFLLLSLLVTPFLPLLALLLIAPRDGSAGQ